MIGLFVALVAAQVPVIDSDGPTIFVPYEMQGEFRRYTTCVLSAFEADARRPAADETLTRLIYADAVSACREVRADAIAKSYKLVAKSQIVHIYGNAAKRKLLVDKAFDRADHDFEIVPARSEKAGE